MYGYDTANYAAAGGANYLGQYNLTTLYRYDEVGNQVAVTDTRPADAPYVTQYGYDRLGRAVVVTDVLGYTATVAYDGLGRRVQATDANGHSVTYAYDALGRTAVVTAGGALSGSEVAVTTASYAQRYPALAYNGDGDEFVALWSDKRYSAAHDYDVYGQVISASGALSGTVYAVFGASGTQYQPSIAYQGSVYWVLWRDGRDYATNNYDIYGRTLNNGGAPSGTVVALATSGAQDLPVVAPLAGSGAGFLALWADYRDEEEADLYGQRLNADGTLRGDNLLFLDGWGYPAGLSLAAHATQPEALFVWDWWGDIVAQRYGLLVAGFEATPVSGSDPLTVTFTNTSTPTAEIDGYVWDFGDGYTSTVTDPVHCYTQNGVYTVSLQVSGAGETETLTRTNYITVTAGGGYTTTTRTITYTYDLLNRLTKADYSTGEQFIYTYDAVGNRTVYTETITQTAGATYAYDAANRLTNVNGVAYTWTTCLRCA